MTRAAPWLFGIGMTALFLVGMSASVPRPAVKCDLSRYVPGVLVPSGPKDA